MPTKYKCCYSPRGCTKIFELKVERNQHVGNDCFFRKIECGQCKKKIMYKDYDKHINEECEYCIELCKQCLSTYYRKNESKHQKECRRSSRTCANCGGSYFKDKAKTHEARCPKKLYQDICNSLDENFSFFQDKLALNDSQDFTESNLNLIKEHLSEVEATITNLENDIFLLKKMSSNALETEIAIETEVDNSIVSCRNSFYSNSKPPEDLRSFPTDMDMTAMSDLAKSEQSYRSGGIRKRGPNIYKQSNKNLSVRYADDEPRNEQIGCIPTMRHDDTSVIESLLTSNLKISEKNLDETSSAGRNLFIDVQSKNSFVSATQKSEPSTLMEQYLNKQLVFPQGFVMEDFEEMILNNVFYTSQPVGNIVRLQYEITLSAESYFNGFVDFDPLTTGEFFCQARFLKEEILRASFRIDKPEKTSTTSLKSTWAPIDTLAVCFCDTIKNELICFQVMDSVTTSEYSVFTQLPMNGDIWKAVVQKTSTNKMLAAFVGYNAP